MSAGGTAVISLEAVRFVRGGRAILDGIDWDIQPGEHWALMGANGSGKTTLLEIVTGYRWPTSGRVHVLGRLFGATDLRELRKRIGYVGASLEYRIYPGQTALQVALSGMDASLRWLGTPSPDQVAAAERALDHVGMLELAHRTFETLSQGERKRALIARALSHAPALLVLDEPCAGLDPRAREEFLADVAQYAAREDTPGIVFVTHHIEEIAPWVNRVHLIRDGETLVQAPPESALTAKWVSQMLDAPCTVRQQNGRYTLELRRD